MPASDSLFAFTITMKRIVVSPFNDVLTSLHLHVERGAAGSTRTIRVVVGCATPDEENARCHRPRIECGRDERSTAVPHAPGHRRRRVAARLRDADRHAAPPSAGAT